MYTGRFAVTGSPATLREVGLPPKVRAAIARDPEIRSALSGFVRPRFNAYLEMTKSVKRALTVPGETHYVYPNGTVMSDLTVFWTLFNDVFELLGKDGNRKAVIQADPNLEAIFKDLLAVLEFWKPSAGAKGSNRTLIRLTAIGPSHYAEVWRTFRNGFSHARWQYQDLSAHRYWKEMGWDTNEPAGKGFGLKNRRRNNYTIYVVDAEPRNGMTFWQWDPMRIVVIPVADLRWHLHRFLSYLLNGSKKRLF